jgi:hypothetical protein
MTSRRRFLALTGATGVVQLVSARQGAAPAAADGTGRRAASYGTLSVTQAKTLDALGDVMLPGAAAAGISHYVDQQLRLPAVGQVLMIRYLGLSAPFTSFYTSGLDALDEWAHARLQRRYAELPVEVSEEIIGALAQGSPMPWSGPPPSLFYFVVRNDAVDVVYGTKAGFATLAVPYMAHISPPTAWPT